MPLVEGFTSFLEALVVGLMVSKVHLSCNVSRLNCRSLVIILAGCRCSKQASSEVLISSLLWLVCNTMVHDEQ